MGSKSELIIEMTVKATNTHKYKEVVLGTYTIKLEPTGKPYRYVQTIRNDIGFSKELNPVFLDSIEVQPRMVEQDVEKQVAKIKRVFGNETGAK
jgi:hypothetical protein